MRPTIQQAAMTGLGLLILAASGARAEEPHTLQEGARVRATMAVETAPIGNHPIRLEGLLSDMDEATITLVTSPDKPPVAILRVEVSKLEMYKGKKSRRTGALIGFGVGAAVGALIGNPSGYEEPATVNGVSAAEEAAIGAVAYGLLGATVGAVITPGDKWETVPTDKIQLGISHRSQGGSGLFLIARF